MSSPETSLSHSPTQHVSLSKAFGLAAFALTACTLISCSPQQPVKFQVNAATEVEIDQGKLVGSENSFGGKQWIGLPYAAAPVGDLRWRAPQAASPWEGLREATEFGPACTQLSGGAGSSIDSDNEFGGSEDCLYLNIYAPADTQKPKAVMMWLHGGSNTHGSADIYDGSRLAQENDVIVVTVNYRLGGLGWFNHPALQQTAQNPDDASGNFGSLDPVQALRWLRDNVEKFGGNPENVTVFGESAGGFDTLNLMLSPVAKGLFHRAIVESGGLWHTPIDEATNYNDAPQAGSRFSSQEIELLLRQNDGLASNRSEAKQQVAELTLIQRAEYLRSKSQAEIMKAYLHYGRDEVDMPLVFQDGHVIPKGDLVERFKNPDQYNKVPLIIGTNRDEIKLYYYSNPKYVDMFLGKIPSIKDPDYYHARAQYHSDRWKYNGADRIAQAISEGNIQHNKENTVWAYRFDWDEQARPMWAELDKLLGASHGMEIPFVFGFTDPSGIFSPIIDKANTPGREALSATMRSLWSQHAKDGQPNSNPNPNPNKSQQWSAWQPDQGEDKFIILDTENGGGLRMSQDIVHPQTFAASIAVDERIPETEKKCGIYASLIREDSTLWSQASYSDNPSLNCSAFMVKEW